MAIQIVDYKETYRLISDGQGHYAVVEARCGHVYSLHGNHRRMALDSDAGMALVVGRDGWFHEQEARECLEAAARGEDYYRQRIW